MWRKKAELEQVSELTVNYVSIALLFSAATWTELMLRPLRLPRSIKLLISGTFLLLLLLPLLLLVLLLARACSDRQIGDLHCLD